MARHLLAAIPGVETFELAPKGLGVNLRISIALTSAAGQGNRPALIYVTDADFSFGTVVEAARMGGQGGEVGPAIVVGIGYAEESGDYAFSQVRRGQDLYRGPRRSIKIPGEREVQLGGADTFLKALLDTVDPEVKRREPRAVHAQRILFGASAGGHFAAHVLMHRPNAFEGYAMISPALIDYPPIPGDDQLVQAARALKRGAIPPGRRVFISVGSLEEEPGDPAATASIISNAYRMRGALAAHGIETKLVVLPGETHISSLGAAVSRALRFLVPPTPVSVQGSTSGDASRD